MGDFSDLFTRKFIPSGAHALSVSPIPLAVLFESADVVLPFAIRNRSQIPAKRRLGAPSRKPSRSTPLAGGRVAAN